MQYDEVYRRILLGREFLVCVSLDHVHHIVAEFFAVIHHVHVVHAHLVAVLLVFDISHILFFKELAVIVDLVLHIQRAVCVGSYHIANDINHVRKCLVAQLHNVLDAVVLLFGKVVGASKLAVNGASHIVAGVTDNLRLMARAIL